MNSTDSWRAHTCSAFPGTCIGRWSSSGPPVEERESGSRWSSCEGSLVSMRRAEREAVFQSQFLEDLPYWVKTDRKAALRTLDLVHATLQDPFAGIGKPEPL